MAAKQGQQRLPESVCRLDWPAPSNVKAVFTTRLGGVSPAPFHSNNLALHVGDDSRCVQENRQQLYEHLSLPSHPQWLEQVHGVKTVVAQTDGLVRTADACFTEESQVVCSVLTADCLPILICDEAGTQVAAVHAGWRSLASGVLRGAVAHFKQPSRCLVYLCPAISQAHFEVGIDVLEGFYEQALSERHCEAISAAIKPSVVRPMKFHADLYALAGAELAELGIHRIYGGQYCTYQQADVFYSFRRDKDTGRMASLIWLD